MSWGLVYYVSEWVIRVVMALIIPFRRSPEAAKGWLLLVLFLPWPALILYLLIGRPSYPRWRRDRFARLAKVFPDATGHEPDRAGEEPPLPDHLKPVAVLARNLGHFPVVGRNRIAFLTDYDGMIDRLVEDIDRAEHEVHLLFYIFASDATGQRVAEALARAVARGIDTRVLVDAQGSRPWARRTFALLAKARVPARWMLPVYLLPWHSTRADLRNHRKIAVIDGRFGYVGSQNVVNRDFRPGIVNQELMVRVEGPVVRQLQRIFLADWYLETEEVLGPDAPGTGAEQAGDTVAQVLPSGPDYAGAGIEHLVVALVHSARERVILVTPYFVPDDALLNAIKTAVLRGVAVHLVVSKVSDQKLVRLAQRSYYAELLLAGVTLHLYKGKLLHAKNLSVDWRMGIVGSSNIDIRSFLLNSEVSLILYDQQSVGHLVHVQEQYLLDSEPLKLDEWGARPFGIRILENLARLLSPLL